MQSLFLHNQVVSAKMALHTFHAEFGDHKATLTVILVDGEPWFRGVDAAAAIGYKDPRKAIYTHVDDDDKTTLGNLGGSYSGLLTKSNKFTTVHISERGLCSLITSSKLPHTKAFKNWVLKDVLPTIRQTGGYITHSVAEDVEPIRTDAQRAHADVLSSSSSSSSSCTPAQVDLHQKMYRDVVNQFLLSIGKQQNPMIDASEFLMRKGHDALEVKRLACEFGRSLKTACQRTGRADAVTNHHEFGCGSSDVRMYHAHVDATFLDAVYCDFQKRELYQRVCVARGASF